MTRTRVNAVGYYGWDNFGDELFRAAIEVEKERIWGAGTRIRSFVTPIRALHQNLGPVGALTRFIESLLGAVWADTIAMCGGSVLQTVRGTQTLRDRLAKLGNTRLEALGVSLGPWSSEEARQLVLGHVARMDRAVVRDRASASRAGTGIRVGGDLAALYPMPVTPRAERSHLTICISNDSKASIDALVSLLSELLPGVTLPVKLLALNVRRGHGDVEISHTIAARLAAVHPDIEVLTFDSVDQTIEIISRSRAVWSQRLHGVIAAYLCEVPVLALSHHQKITDFARDIELPDRFIRQDLGLDEELRGAARATLESGPHARVSPAAYRALTRDALIR